MAEEQQASVEDRIAAHLYGPPESEPAPEAAPVETAEKPAEPVESPAEPVADTEAKEPEAVETDEETLEVETLSQLAEHFNIEPADLYNLRLPVDMEGGERTEVTLGEIKDAFRARESSEAATRKATQQREAFEARQAQIEAAHESRMQETAAVLQVAEQQLAQEYQNINWAELQADDPGEYAARRLAFNERAASMDAAKRQLVQSWEQAQAAKTQETEQHRVETLEREQAAMLKAIPEWRDEDAARSERAALATYLGASGFSDEEVGGVADHRVVVMARKAMLYDKHVKVADATKKRVVRLSSKKPLQPNARQSQADRQSDALVPVRQQLRKSGRYQDAAALISARLGRSE